MRGVSIGQRNLNVFATSSATDQAFADNVLARTFTITAAAPTTTIEKKPANVIQKTKATYKFESNIPNAEFMCSIDGTDPIPCVSPMKYEGLTLGKHTFEVFAIANGEHDASPATDGFKVKKR